MRIFVDPLRRALDPNPLEKVDSSCACLPRGQPVMLAQGFADLVPDSEYWVQRRHRFLENHGDLLAPNPAKGVLVLPRKIASLEQDGTPFDLARRLDQAQDR